MAVEAESTQRGFNLDGDLLVRMAEPSSYIKNQSVTHREFVQQAHQCAPAHRRDRLTRPNYDGGIDLSCGGVRTQRSNQDH